MNDVLRTFVEKKDEICLSNFSQHLSRLPDEFWNILIRKMVEMIFFKLKKNNIIRFAKF